MAVVNTKSTEITNADATPATLNNPGLAKGTLLSVAGTVETGATDSDNSVYRLVRVPSNAILRSVKLFNDDLDTNVSPAIAADVGVYQTAANGGAVVDRDILATVITALQGAVITGTELRFEVDDIADAQHRLWEVLGLTADPQRDYDICLTIETVAATPAAGTITLVVEYTV